MNIYHMNECQFGTAYSLRKSNDRVLFCCAQPQYKTCVSHLLGYQQMLVNENKQ